MAIITRDGQRHPYPIAERAELSGLSTEILLKIFRRLPAEDLCSVDLTCRKFKQLNFELTQFSQEHMLSALKYIYQNIGKNNFCLKVYTPPVIPYTYDYLTSYYSRVKGFKKPSIDFTNNQCWYIIEDDFYKFRLDKWKSTNIPKEAILTKTKKFTLDYSIELWTLPL